MRADSGFQAATVPDDVLLKPGVVIAIGVEPVRIELLNAIDGMTFAEARGGTVRSRYGGVEVTFIGRSSEPG
jgi:hypothetical protein